MFAMKPPAPILASALALALLLPGLVAVLPACTMADCEPAIAPRTRTTATPLAATSIAAGCCRLGFAAAATLPTLPDGAPARGPVIFFAAPRTFSTGAATRWSSRQLESHGDPELTREPAELLLPNLSGQPGSQLVLAQDAEAQTLIERRVPGNVAERA